MLGSFLPQFLYSGYRLDKTKTILSLYLHSLSFHLSSPTRARVAYHARSKRASAYLLKEPMGGGTVGVPRSGRAGDRVPDHCVRLV